ncbi:hypothetical protein HY389_01805 [Candidatus Daviesbacteria bacterium]|nr:hypothetical protein [Candidatus Daviesbacteria bacterium]
MELKKVILQILDIIGYQGDKESYAQKFVEVCYKQALLELILKLPENTPVPEATNVEDIQKFISEHFSKEEEVKALESTVSKNLKQYFEAVLPTLSDQQKTQLQNYLQSNQA